MDAKSVVKRRCADTLLRRCAVPAPQDQNYAAWPGYRCIGARVRRLGPNCGGYRCIGVSVRACAGRGVGGIGVSVRTRFHDAVCDHSEILGTWTLWVLNPRKCSVLFRACFWGNVGFGLSRIRGCERLPSHRPITNC